MNNHKKLWFLINISDSRIKGKQMQEGSLIFFMGTPPFAKFELKRIVFLYFNIEFQKFFLDTIELELYEIMTP